MELKQKTNPFSSFYLNFFLFFVSFRQIENSIDRTTNVKKSNGTKKVNENEKFHPLMRCIIKKIYK